MLESILLLPLLPGVIFIVAGFILFKYPPKNINGLYGYRTGASMKSQEHWDFAQIYAGKEMIRMGVVLVLLSFIGLFFEPGIKSRTFIGMFLLIAVSGTLLTRVQRAIKQKFGED